MTKKDFFRIIIKLFGLYSTIISLFTILPSSISYITSDFGLIGVLYFILSGAVVVSLFVLLIFKADTVIQLLNLDKGFDDERIYFENLNADNIIKLGSIIVGGFLLMDNLAPFIIHSLYSFQDIISGDSYSTKNKFDLAVSLVNLIFGYLLLTNYNYVVKILKSKNQE